ncbi:T9SS type A sorting domain-containing protein [Ferruginibacter lapsinanis]|uniref:T9SS type A sorting domain-containing protein n=1 Tax=Ferruginibacter lapsinanis TaxID=563172 RepID=UPI001E59A8B9|nr:T9SS type A sorting domain-containing protein [Ferruginibacter lapsinanis]UEG49501.1 T9SS type A sorting domain-containing protein [Ferruginibacter lapsinanis]
MKRLLFLGLSFCVFSSRAQQIAFPTAEGMGKYTTGGRGTSTVPTTVYEVTNLLDDNQPGCFRYAATKSGPAYRTIVFRVSGTIHLTSKISLNRPNTTIAGQTAPGDGICIADYPVSISADNLIIRYIRFRLGDKNQNLGKVNGSGNDDTFGGTGHKNIIVDHCTMSWSDDEAFSIYDGDSTTVQWNILSEPLNYSYHFETGDVDFEHHGYGGIWGGKHTTAHHNLIAHVQGRAPRFCGSRFMGDGATAGLENVDFRNNVIYDWGSYNVNGGEGGNYNVVNNYYKYGLSTSNSSSTRGMIINPGKTATLPYGKYYLEGNYVQGSTTRTNNNWFGAVMSGGTTADTSLAKVTIPFTFLPIVTQTALEAYESVLKGAGCSLPNRDTLDARIVNDVINRTGKIIDVQGNYPAHSTSTPEGFAATVNAWPTLVSTPAPADTDHDGMPDEWEMERGLNSADAADRNGYHSNGYTNIENYLNGDSIVAYGKVNNCVVARTINASGSTNWLFAKDSTYTRLVSTDTNNVVAAILDNGAANTFNVSYYTTATTRYYNTLLAYLNRNITITPAVEVTSPVTVRFYFTVAEYNQLKTADATITSLGDLRILKIADNNCITALTGTPEVIVPTSFGNYGTYQKGYYVEFQTSSFSTFFIGSATAFPVPVKLISFNAALNGDQVKTTWVSENEINADRFIVERSADQQFFTPVGVISAANSTLQNSYSFIDKNPLDGIAYYRLQIIDKDGKFVYSKIVPVIFKTQVDNLFIYPNPVKDVLNISYPQHVKNGLLNIFSSDGKRIMQIKMNPNAINQSINITALQKGIYALVAVFENRSETIRFIKN